MTFIPGDMRFLAIRDLLFLNKLLKDIFITAGLNGEDG